jgi:hypothetical protein
MFMQAGVLFNRHQRDREQICHDSQLSSDVFIEDTVEQERILSWGLTAGVFVLLLAFSSWNGGWWRSEASPVAHTRSYGVTPTDAAAANPFAPRSEFVPTPVAEPEPVPVTSPSPAAVINSTPAVVPAGPEQSDPQNENYTSDIDYEAQAVERNRGVEHGSRTH